MGGCLDTDPLPTPGPSGPHLLSSLLTRVKPSVNSKAAFSLMALGAMPFPIFPWQNLFTHSPEPWLGRPEPGSPGGTDLRKRACWAFTTINSKRDSRGAPAEYLMIHFFKGSLFQGDRPVSISLKTSGLEGGLAWSHRLIRKQSSRNPPVENRKSHREDLPARSCCRWRSQKPEGAVTRCHGLFAAKFWPPPPLRTPAFVLTQSSPLPGAGKKQEPAHGSRRPVPCTGSVFICP